GRPDQLDAGETLGDRGRIADDHGDLRPTQLLDRRALGQSGAAGDDQVGAEGDDLLDVDAVEGRDLGNRRGLRREVGGVLDLADDAIAGADREQRLGRRRGEGDDLVRLGRDRDGRALIVGEGDGERGGRGGRDRRRRRERCRRDGAGRRRGG